MSGYFAKLMQQSGIAPRRPATGPAAAARSPVAAPLPAIEAEAFEEAAPQDAPRTEPAAAYASPAQRPATTAPPSLGPLDRGYGALQPDRGAIEESSAALAPGLELEGKVEAAQPASPSMLPEHRESATLANPATEEPAAPPMAALEMEVAEAEVVAPPAAEETAPAAARSASTAEVLRAVREWVAAPAQVTEVGVETPAASASQSADLVAFEPARAARPPELLKTEDRRITTAVPEITVSIGTIQVVVEDPPPPVPAPSPEPRGPRLPGGAETSGYLRFRRHYLRS